MYLITREVKTKIIYFRILAVAGTLSAVSLSVSAQDLKSLSLENAVNLALEKNHLLAIKKFMVEEKQQKMNEDRVKYLPVIGLGGTYQYNTNLQELTIEQGRFGQLPYGGIMIPLPATNEVFMLGKHNIYNAGVTFYQPITQLGKINAGVRYTRTEMQIAKTEESKAVLQVKQGVEKLFFGLLIVQKQIEEAELKVSLAKVRLHDAESALAAGKTIESSIYGLSAGMADEQQNLLKLKIQYDDYASDLIQLTGLDPSATLVPEPVATENLTENIVSIDTSLSMADSHNNDLRLAALNKTKADYSIRASKYSYLPDLGIQGGYTYQEGIDIYPRNNTYIGASMKWNLNDVLSNRMIQKQRIYARQQAEENLLNTREQIIRDIAKSYRRLKQSEELIKVAGKVVEYRREDLKIQSDRRRSGLNLETDLLAAKASMAKAEADLYAAQLNYRIALSELKILTGAY
jgi:outer membrane protein